MPMPHNTDRHKDPCCSIVVYPYRRGGLIRLI